MIILFASKDDAFDQRASHLANVGLGNLRKDVLKQKCHLIILIYNPISGVIKNGLFTVRPRGADAPPPRSALSKKTVFYNFPPYIDVYFLKMI